jgi:hypothetical protein
VTHKEERGEEYIQGGCYVGYPVCILHGSGVLSIRVLSGREMVMKVIPCIIFMLVMYVIVAYIEAKCWEEWYG